MARKKEHWQSLIERASRALESYVKEKSPVANNYLLFSEQIETESEEAAHWIEKQLKAAEESEDGGICSYERVGASIWLYSEESADVDRLADLLADYQKKFGDQKAIILSWALTCSKPRLSEFSGGAAVIVGGHVRAMTARDWAYTLADELVPQLTEKKKRKKERRK